MTRLSQKENKGVRPLLSNPRSNTSLSGGGVLIAEEPTGPRIKLVCTAGDVNWVFKLKEPLFRVGSTKSPISSVRCLCCNEMLKGGEILK